MMFCFICGERAEFSRIVLVDDSPSILVIAVLPGNLFTVTTQGHLSIYKLLP
jgi:hypothetical protein